MSRWSSRRCSARADLELSDDQRADRRRRSRAAAEPFSAADGSIALPGSSLVAVAAA